jgi:hypothetical protein
MNIISSPRKDYIGAAVLAPPIKGKIDLIGERL